MTTNTVKHTPTPGPWFADENAGYVYSRPGPLTRFVIAASESGTMDEQIANVRLMAAAPDLLEALKLVADSGKFTCFDDAAWDAVNDAISKATGSPAPQEKGGE